MSLYNAPIEEIASEAVLGDDPAMVALGEHVLDGLTNEVDTFDDDVIEDLRDEIAEMKSDYTDMTAERDLLRLKIDRIVDLIAERTNHT